MKFNDNTAFVIEENEYSTADSRSNHSSNRLHRPRQSKKTNPIVVFVCGLVVTVLLFVMIYGKVQVSALYTQISDEKSVVDILESENVRMQSEIEGNMSLKNVESYAEDVLGLKKLEKSQIVYIQIQSEDVVQVVESESNVFVKIKEKFNSLVEYLFD